MPIGRRGCVQINEVVHDWHLIKSFYSSPFNRPVRVKVNTLTRFPEHPTSKRVRVPAADLEQARQGTAVNHGEQKVLSKTKTLLPTFSWM